MKVQVKLLQSKEAKKINLVKDSIVFDLLKKLGIKPDTAIVMKKNIPMPEDEKIQDNDVITILKVSSGG